LAQVDAANRALVLIALDDAAVAQAQDRFVVRMSDETIYGGIVLLRDRPRWMKRPDLMSLAGFILAGDYENATQTFIAATPHHMVKRSQLSLFLPHPEDQEILERLRAQGKIVCLDETVMSVETRSLLSQRLVETVVNLSKVDQGSIDQGGGAALETVRLNLIPKIDRATFQALVEEEVQKGKLVRAADKLMVAGRTEAAADPAAQRLQEEILGALANSFCLDLEELAKACKTDSKKIKSAVQSMTKQSPAPIHLINYEFAISNANLEKAHRALADIWNVKRNIAPTDFKEHLNVTRKYAMALLQHFDDQKITRRLNDGRVLLKAPKS
jgi:selenocysteine-specific elongation factor